MTALRCAIVGAGPAGFYAAQQLLDAGFEVDVLDSLPTPFGLVRSGVAPDHPKIKSVVVDPADVPLDVEGAVDGTARRNVALLHEYAQRPAPTRRRRIVLRFLRSPVEILGDAHGAVAALRVVRNRIVRNDAGRVCDADGTALPGEYAVGWIKRGPSGVIGTNKKDAADTFARILEDRDASRLNRPANPHRDAIAALARGLVGWGGWKAIDAHERAAGEPHGRPRVKVVQIARLREIAGSS